MVLCLASDATGVRVLGGCVDYGAASIVAVLAVLRRRELVAVLAVAGRGGMSELIGASKGKGSALSTSAVAHNAALEAAKPPRLRRELVRRRRRRRRLPSVKTTKE